MQIVVRRVEYGNDYTVGRMCIDGAYECYTLEDKVRPPGVKIQNETAIPAGIYSVVVNYSPHFGHLMPELLDVPMFEGVRIHQGNTDANTDGCILVGNTWAGGDFIGNSDAAFNVLFPKIQAALQNNGTVTIEIQDTK